MPVPRTPPRRAPSLGGLHLPAAALAPSVGARDVAKDARSGCFRRKAIGLLGGSDALVAEHMFDLNPGRISPIAILSGNQEEAAALEGGAAAIQAAYCQAGILGAGDVGFEDLVDTFPMNPKRAKAVRRQRAGRTSALLAARLAGDPTVPAILAHPALRLDLPSGEHAYIEPDCLVAPAGALVYRNLEIKSFPHQDGFTSSSAMVAAAWQAAAGVLAHRQALVAVDPAAAALVPAATDLWLRGRRLVPDVSVEAALHALEANLDAAPATRAEVEAELRAAGCSGEVGANDLMALPCRLTEDCRDLCSMYNACRRQAEEQGSLIVLGRSAERAFGPAGDRARVEQIADGRVRTARSPEEEALAERIDRAQAALRAAAP